MTGYKQAFVSPMSMLTVLMSKASRLSVSLFITLIALMTLTGCTQENKHTEQSDSVFKDEIVEEIESLKVGICFDDASAEHTITDENQNVAVTSIPIVPCHKPHDNEVYYIYELADAKAYQETEALLESMFVSCEDKFEGYIGQPYQDSLYKMSFLTPTVESWAEGDREVVCYAFHPDADKLSSSLHHINLHNNNLNNTNE